jgi:glycosyltransferase involved in cell wall biosynthesis
LIDTESSDETVSKAKREKISVFTFPYSRYVEPVRAFAIAQVQTEWVFILDADERITAPLAEKIRQAIQDPEFSHYAIARKNIFAGKKWLTHGGWYPDYVLRLISKKHFLGWPKSIHSTPQIAGKKGFIRSPLEHYFHPNLENMVAKTALYEDIESQLLFEANKSVQVKTFFRKFFGELFRRLIKNRGYQDGTYGIIESIYQAYSKTLTYVFLYEKKQKSTSV